MQTIRMYEERGVAPLIPNLETTWKSVVNFTPGSLYHPHPLPPTLPPYESIQVL
jgi:hypothetical protein